MKSKPARCCSLSVDFKKNGFFPRKKVEEPKGTATILSDENASLKEKIKELEQEIESLRDMNIRLGSRLQTIRRLACYDEADIEIDD
jgi:predicted RNase H-like nuclease (RuvC/YqgF family)